MQLDAKNQELLAKRRAWFEARTIPMVGDYVRFVDDVERRISYRWDFGDATVQTSAGGSFYIDVGVVSFSGGLYPSIAVSTLTLTEERKSGRFWFFDHDISGAGRGIEVSMPCRVWRCALTGKDPFRPRLPIDEYPANFEALLADCKAKGIDPAEYIRARKVKE